MVNETGQTWSARFGLAFNVTNVLSADWFNDYTLTFAQKINQTTTNTLSDMFAQAQLEGWSIGQMQSRMGTLFEQWMSGNVSAERFDWYAQRMPPYRTELIARTETMRAANAGSYNLFKSWKASYKNWMATGDDRTRPSHLKAWTDYGPNGGKAIPIDEPFLVGGSQLMQPGDPAGPLSETAMCRCAILPAMNANGTFDEAEAAANMGAVDYQRWQDQQAIRDYAQQWQSFWDTIDPAQKDAFIGYTGPDYRPMNYYLRNQDWGYTDDPARRAELLQNISHLDANYRNSTSVFKENAVVGRGMEAQDVFKGMSQADLIDLFTSGRLVGTIQQDNGFMSASIDTNMAYRWGGDYYAEFHVPKGFGGVYLENVTIHPREYEYLFPRGTRYKIIEASYHPGARKPFTIVAEIIDAQPREV